jgi:hypothetical protein
MTAQVWVELKGGDLHRLKAPPHEKTDSFCGEMAASHALPSFLREEEELLAQVLRSAKSPPPEN